MKSTRIALLAFLAVALMMMLPSLASARCKARSIAAWPDSGETLPANRPMIVLRAYGSLQGSLEALDGDSLELVSESDTVDVEIVETLESRKRLTQAILRPTQPLEPGETYSLKVAIRREPSPRVLLLSDDDESEEAEAEKVEYRTWSWKVGEADTKPPAFTGPAKKGDEEYARLGCGPRSYVDVKTGLVGDEFTRVTYLGELRNKSDLDDVQRFYVRPGENGTVRIGHGMCSGEFAMKNGESYELTLWAVDRAGNRSAASDTILLEGPEPKEK